MEGGYHLGALADGAEQHLLALLHGSCRPDGLVSIEGSALGQIAKLTNNSYGCGRGESRCGREELKHSDMAWWR